MKKSVLLYKIIFSSLLFHHVISSSSSRRIPEASSTTSCTINKTIADCSSKHLTTIPHLSATTTKLVLDHNSFKLLKSNSFSSLSALTNLSMTNCQLKDLDKDTFSGLKNLLSLDLSNNSIKTLPPSIFNDLKNLKSLYFKNNSMIRISQHVFDNLTKLEDLHLDHNLIASIHPHAFTKLTSIKSISIDHNHLTVAYKGWFFPVNATLAHISLGHNPWICDANMCGWKNWTAIGHKKFSETIDVFCKKQNTSLKNIHSKDLCAMKTVKPPSTTTNLVSATLGSTAILNCTDGKSTSWKFMSKSKNGSITRKPIEQNEKIKIKPGKLFVTGVSKHDSGSYCCYNSVSNEEDILLNLDGKQNTIAHCQKVKVTTHNKKVSSTAGGGSGGAAAAIIVILVIAVIGLTIFWYMRRKRRNYGLLSDETVFQPTYDDLQSTTHLSSNNADMTGTGEAYV